MKVLGIDTSNYTTSVALVSDEGYRQERLILDVDSGKRGLRQSDALFLHTKNLPVLFEKLGSMEFDAVAYSSKPRDAEGSYMPCFLAGESVARSIASSKGVPVFSFSHQAGHIEAAVRTCGGEAGNEFLAFHLSGGTTEILKAEKNRETGYKVEIVGNTKDISAGQLIDRIGVLLGLKFPCGAELEKLAEKCTDDIKVHVSVKEGSCNLSGAENKISEMIKDRDASYVAKYTLAFVAENIIKMTEHARSIYPALPVIYAGGVMRNGYIRKRLSDSFDNILFAETELSSDNAVGTAYLGLGKLTGEADV